MLDSNKVNKYLLFSLLIVFILFLLFNKKNFKLLINNFDTIEKKQIELISNIKKKKIIEDDISNFKNRKEYRELKIKEKLFLKDRSEDVILYESNN
tara:strand:- start:97 stop:384 length:288 start_codon:yes stop_codon:yes gene_type:complete